MLNPNVDLFHGSWINIHEITNDPKPEMVIGQIEETTPDSVKEEIQ